MKRKLVRIMYVVTPVMLVLLLALNVFTIFSRSKRLKKTPEARRPRTLRRRTTSPSAASTS